ncbi:MAG: hypothetical protein WDM91_23170 [Rhizomicrobium sp.]
MTNMPTPEKVEKVDEKKVDVIAELIDADLDEVAAGHQSHHHSLPQ